MNEKIKAWLVAAGLRCVRTMAQTAVSLLAVATVMSEVDWLMVGSASLLAGIISLLMSISGLPECEEGATLGQLMKGE